METKTKLRLSLVVNAVAIALIVSNCEPQQTDECTMDENVAISKTQAALLAYTYQSQLREDPTSDKDKGDSRSSWFSVAEIEAFICKARRQQQVNQTPGPLGIRIYYGRYPDQSLSHFDFDPDYRGKHCLFFVPTVDVQIPKVDQEKFGGDTVFRKDFEIEGKNFLFSGTKRNHGALVPPENAEGSMFAYVTQQDVNP